MSAIEIAHISKSFDKQMVLRDITFTIFEGEYVAVLGPSGCGKTTLLKTIAGLYPPDSGRILIRGNDVTYVDPELRNVGFFFQNYALFPHLSVEQNVAYGLSLKKVERQKQGKIVRDYLLLVGLADWAQHFPHQLSGGMQQRVALARALAVGSKIMLLDEPLNALDAKMAALLRIQLKELAKKLDLTVLHVTPNQDEAIEVSDRIILMREGKIVQIETNVESYLHPTTLFAAYFIGESNFFTAERVDDHRVKYGDILFGLEQEIFGKEMVMAIRCEKIRFDGKEQNTLSGVVRTIHFLGKTLRYEIDCKGKSVFVETSKHSGIKVGKHVSLYFPPQDLLVFPRSQVVAQEIPGI